MVIKSMVFKMFFNCDSYWLQLRSYFKFNHGEDRQNMTRIKQGAAGSHASSR